MKPLEHTTLPARPARSARPTTLEVVQKFFEPSGKDAMKADRMGSNATGTNLVVVRTGPLGYRTEVQADGHTLIVDEPLKLGGTDLGPTPYHLLAAALGACTSITLRMYANRKGWPVGEISVSLSHRRVHAVDSEECETREPRIDKLERVIHIDGPLSDEQRARMLEIADRCPVHRTLTAGIHIETRMATPES